MIDNLTKEQRKVLLMWIIFGALLMGFLSIFAGVKIYEKKKKYEQTKDKNYIIVTDYSRYYTIINILDKYYSFVNSKNDESIIKLLNENYKKDNNINKDNLKDKITFYDKNVTYKGRLMCSKRLGKGYTSYYVAGEVIGSNSVKTYETVYYEVLLNENDMTFSISILDSSVYGGGCHA